MIKIILKDEANQCQHYLDTVGVALAARLTNMQRSIGHLTGAIPPGNDQGDFTGYKSTTIALVNLVDKNTYDFSSGEYKDSVDKYLLSSLKLPVLPLKNMSDFIAHLLDKNEHELKELLLCAPLALPTKNDDLIKLFDLDAVIESEMVKIAFDYSQVPDIGEIIRTFFRKENFVLFCPYCNFNDAAYIKTEHDEAAAIHQLDHFLYKAKTPLLCYSFFNLVPADANCNGKVNKGSVPFDNTNFLNPYLGGFGQGLTFKIIGTGQKITKIELVLKGKPGDELYDRMVGTTKMIDERTDSGNINIFALQGKYDNDYVWKKAGKAAMRVAKKAAQRRSLKDFFKRMDSDVRKATHLTWYEEEYDGCFHPAEFNDERFSKLYRDIHDTIFAKDKRWANRVIRQMINEHPQ